jgi:tRNA pseudouridine55 synthase
MSDGLLIVYKTKGCTSHDVINKIRRKYKIKKCGHSGTLDPMAQGVLLVFIGKALKLLNFLPKEKLDKQYLMRITLGVTTDSYDATGKITNENNKGLSVSDEEISEALKSFSGIIDQIPPIFSAVKVKGKRAYEKARAGEDFEVASRKVNIKSIELINNYIDDNRRNLVIRVSCSRGTYVRSIAHELGQKLGCGAHLSYLLREKVGDCSYNRAFPMWKLDNAVTFENSESFIKMEDILPISKITVTDEGAEQIKHVRPIARAHIVGLEAESDQSHDQILMLNKSGKLLGLYRKGTAQSDAGSCVLLLPIKVFNDNED